jgi:trimeric autotransporter adhesin
VAEDFSAAAPVVADTGIGPITGREYPASLIRADPWGIQPRVGVAWRPIPTSSILLRAGYGIYRNTSVYQSLAQQMAQQPPLSFAFNSTSTPETPLTLAHGFIPPVATTLNTLALDPDFRIGTIHRWQASAQRDLPGGLTAVATYLAGKGINLPQSFIPNTYPVGVPNPCAACPTGFVYTTSGGTSLQNAGQFELRRRQRSGLAWTATYTLTKATDNASSFNGTGGNIAQNWLDLDAERATSSFEQRHQFRFTVTYNTGTGIDGGGVRRGLLGRIVNNWAMNADVVSGSGTPRTPVYLVRPVAGVSGTVRGSLTGLPIDEAPEGFYANPAAFTTPAPGAWGDAPRNSIRGPAQFALNVRLSRSFLSGTRFAPSWGIDVTNLLNTVVYTGINTTVGSQQFGLPTSVGGMRRISTRMSMQF